MKTSGKNENRPGILKQVSGRIRNQEGASLMAALLFFVFCGVGASIILASASASAGKIRRLPREEQKRYAVDSAAEFLRDELTKTESIVKIKEVYVKHDLCDQEDTYNVSYYYVGSQKNNNTEGPWQSFSDTGVLDSFIKSIYTDNRDRAGQDGTENEISTDDSLEKEFTLTVKPTSGSSSLDLEPLKVKVVLTMSSGCGIQALISDTVTSDEKEEERCERLLTLTPVVDWRKQIKVETDTHDVVTGTDWEGNDKTEDCTIETTTYLTTISWKDGTVKKELLEKDDTQ